MVFVREKDFYKRLVYLVIPMALQNIVSFSVGVADNLMVGSLGGESIAGVFVSNQVQNILHMLVLGLSASMGILAAQYWGKREASQVKNIIGIGLKFSTFVGLTCFIFVFLFPDKILSIFTNEQDVINEGLKYIRIICFSYIFFCITNVLIGAMRCVENVRIGLIVSLSTLFINVFLNWVLIFGNLGAPRMGVEGAAIATLIARIVESIIMLVYVRLIDKKIKVRFHELIRSNTELVKDFFKYGIPVITGDILWGIGGAVQTAIIGRLGTDAIASSSIANIIFQVFAVLVYSTAGASSVIIGQTVGAGDYIKLKQYVKTLQIIFLGLGLISGLALFLSRDLVLGLYDNVNLQTRAVAKQFLTVLSFTLVGTAYQMSVLTGIVRAGGATYFVLVNDIIFVWGIVIPSALIAAFVLDLPPVVVFACLKCDQILKCGVAVVKVNRFKWMKNLTREMVG